MRGDNPIRPPESGDGTQLAVKEIFPTLQGEGPFAGIPSVFIRLGGCNLACDFCDTEFENFTTTSLFKILSEVDSLSRNTQKKRVRKLVVLTGGEPFRQNIVPLCDAMIESGFAVQIETNGTLWRDIHPDVNVVCSPKNTGQGYQPLRGDVLERLNAVKFIVSRYNPLYGDVGEVGQTEYKIPVYVQPMDEGDTKRTRENTAYALQLANERGYRLSLQTHKILGIA